MKIMENRIDIAKFTVNDMTFSNIDHILIKENLTKSESENFDEGDCVNHQFLSKSRYIDRELNDDDRDKW